MTRHRKSLRIITLAVSLFFGVAGFAGAVEVGDKAPDFELDSTAGGKLKLSSLRGKTVLLNFYILDFDPGWIQHIQMSGSDDNYAKFTAENAEVLGISANTRFSQKAFADFTKVKHPLLSDRDGKVMKTYDVFQEKRGTANRSYVIVDKEGIVRFKQVLPSGNPKFLISTDGLLNEVKKINKGS